MIESRFDFRPEGPAPWGWRCVVSDGVASVAHLALYEHEGEWPSDVRRPEPRPAEKQESL